MVHKKLLAAGEVDNIFDHILPHIILPSFKQYDRELVSNSREYVQKILEEQGQNPTFPLPSKDWSTQPTTPKNCFVWDRAAVNWSQNFQIALDWSRQRF